MRKAEIHSGCDVLHAVCMAGWCGNTLCTCCTDNTIKEGSWQLPVLHVRQRTMKKELEKLTSADEILAYKVGWTQE
ncbi:hypothetical protein U9C44_23565 [Escherichia coli]|uniref:hypothetical protein n=1 Tax=Escherichia coli TaxID=562 RepID=UPI0019B85038|nr:hypothetical protein [Escherichia coli]EGC6344988.1 hypothetical protein [Escherichia coli]MEA1172572.1 hypothetical protein [Escherichia coli]